MTPFGAPYPTRASRPRAPRVPKVPRARSEHNEQALLFQWIDLEAKQWPEMALIFAIPNGGFRHARTAALMKAEGVRRGVPDVFWPLPKVDECGETWAGLFIEMKVEGGRLDQWQQALHVALHSAGYMVMVAWTFEEARKCIEHYRAGSAPEFSNTNLVRSWVGDYVEAVNAQRDKEQTRRQKKTARGW